MEEGLGLRMTEQGGLWRRSWRSEAQSKQDLLEGEKPGSKVREESNLKLELEEGSERDSREEHELEHLWGVLLTSSCVFFSMGLAGSSPQKASASVPPSKPRG